MTRAQRRTHLIAWLVLGPAVAVVLVLALGSRRDARSPAVGGSSANATNGARAAP